ncbi:tyrosinase-like protein [Rhypophila decipiens]|uniref:Tyrosinase-like protein n=1 Tax=Rhypophila decipiens TaxID=261697 RepID=A0AAN6XZS2_9PEZI|nr:tyrosinase-like protein [Rhypophila decipiens]
MFLKPSSLCLLTAAALSVPASAAPDLPFWAQPAIDSGLALAGLNGIAVLKTLSNFKGGCNPANLEIRQEWRTLSKAQRRNFIAATECLQKKPSVLPAGVAPGSKSIFDDFVFVHMRQTPTIHLTGNFLTWHRWYLHTYEAKLRECGYNGNLPYWEWGFDVNSPRDSPVFDGSDTSLGSDGAAIPHQGIQIVMPFTDLPIPFAPGTGGGCVFKGPFKNMTVHLGPVNLPLYGSANTTGQENPALDNPRCLTRDLNPDVAKRVNSFRNTTRLILDHDNVGSFQGHMSGDPRYVSGQVGIHGGGHFIMGGNPGSDPFVAPGDPAFYLHHAQLDRVFWIWQMLDFQNRQKVADTNTLMNTPPSANTTVEDWLEVDPLNARVQIKEMMNTVGGKLCYIYI